jgi:DNA ligase-4
MMLTIKDINDLLNALAAASNEKERREVFRVIYTRSTAEEQYWFIRIVLKGEGSECISVPKGFKLGSDFIVLPRFFSLSDLKVGLTERTVLKKYHVNAFERYEVNTNLRRVCTELSDPAYRIPSQVRRIFGTWNSHWHFARR